MKLAFNRFLINIIVLLPLIINSNLYATPNSPLWKDDSKQVQLTQQLSAKSVKPITARHLKLNELGLKSILMNDANSIAARALNGSVTDSIIELPLPDGREVSFKITPSSVMSKALALQFPEIKTWKVSAVYEDITGTIDFTHQGFHAMLMMPSGDTVFIEPNSIAASNDSAQKAFTENGQYLSLSKRANKENFKSEFSCGTHKGSSLNFSSMARKGLSNRLQARPASDLITYRLAVATTGEYTQFHGGSVSSALSAIVTTINRVNQIYERDLSIRFQLVDEQSELIYLNPNTDPYTNNDVSKLIEENSQNLSNSGVLSTANYDIGHVFGAGNVGGLAQVGSVCNINLKAQGATGISSPINEVFALDYVAHELGHQVGGTHTFNSNCGGNQRTGVTAVEPGSGSTIMSYAGICQLNDIQSNVDDYFHVASIAQIRNFSRDGDGSGCGILTNTSNEDPTVDGGNDFTVPARTPVVFIANGTDPDNDLLSYTWEQTDTGSVSNVNIDTGDNAFFRSVPPNSSGVRYIPQLSDLFNNATTKGEIPPERNRSMEMVVTVRDGKGGIEADLINMNVFDTGETFSVTSHTRDQNIKPEEQHIIRWNVAGTNTAPISCSNVDIGLTSADGNSIDILTTPNDGQQQITIPEDAPDMGNARFIVSCNNSGFFNVSSGRLSVGEGNSGGGGGSMSVFILSLFSLLLWRRNFSF